MQKYCFKILKRYHKVVLLMVVISFALYSCSEIIAEDISDKEINTIIPIQDDVIASNSITFKWSELDDVDAYQIQIVKPSFTNPVAFVIDSLVTVTNISFELSPNNYQWRVRGINNISETAYSEPIGFEVDEVIELTDQIVILSTPEEDVYLNTIQSNFTWNLLSAADSYVFQIVKGDENSNTIIEQATPTNNFYLPTETGLTEDLYTWKVKAKNAFSETVFAFRKFHYDITLPNTPVLLSPDNQVTSSTSVEFSWNTGTDGGNVHAPLTNVLEIATTNSFGSLINTSELTENNLNYTFATTGTYYWRVKTFDQAGNVGTYSEIREIIIE